ncbi:MAG TPA: hypothetical protein VI997_09870 [Candidatus Thermoplasmatota archaeon]|nr:hypothetical protein [Candidatus Thermoplasmatota archaeon]
MAFAAIVHDKLWKEIPAESHDDVRAAMRSLVALKDPTRSPDVRALQDPRAYRGSFRLRAGRCRVLFIAFPDEKTIVFTTAFLKKRESDYEAAIDRHASRVRAYE